MGINPNDSAFFNLLAPHSAIFSTSTSVRTLPALLAWAIRLMAQEGPKISFRWLLTYSRLADLMKRVILELFLGFTRWVLVLLQVEQLFAEPVLAGEFGGLPEIEIWPFIIGLSSIILGVLLSTHRPGVDIHTLFSIDHVSELEVMICRQIPLVLQHFCIILLLSKYQFQYSCGAAIIYPLPINYNLSHKNIPTSLLIIIMADSNQIRESLMRIKQSQADLLRELRSEHSNLQGFLTASQNLHPNLQHKQTWKEYHYQTPSYENSLELSKSEGNLPNFRNFQFKGSTTTGAEDILENNYKKIEELLIKQRKLYEQNHALQEENESLGDDYRQIKKMYYELKQSHKDNLIILNFLLNQIVYNGFRDLLIEVPNSEITSKTAKSWNRFKIEHPKLFVATSSTQQFCGESQKYLQKIYSLLEQDFKLNTIKTKEEQIVELKQKIAYLINMNSETTKSKQDLLQTQQKLIIDVEKDNSKLQETVRRLEKQLADNQKEGIARLKNLQTEIITKEKEINRLGSLLQQKQTQIDNYNGQSSKLKSQLENTSKNTEESLKELKIVKQKLKQKQSSFQSQIELNRRQNTTIQKLTQDLSLCRSQLQSLPQKSNQSHSQLISMNEQMNRQLQALRQEYNRYRQNTQRQISSLLEHTKQIKSHHAMLVKSEENARLNEMRYREMVAAKANTAKMTHAIDHLWAVKEIEYANITSILGTFRTP